MIVVIRSPVALRGVPAGSSVVGGLAGGIAMAAAGADRRVQLVGKVGDDEVGDALLIALAAAGVGHAAILRDAAHATPVDDVPPLAADDEPFPADDPDPPVAAGLPLDPADVQLALRYLTDFRVLVLVPGLGQATVETAIDGAGFAGAHLIRLVGATEAADAAAEGDATSTTLVAPDGAEPAFARFVGSFASGLDAGREPRDAFDEATRGTNWERARA